MKFVIMCTFLNCLVGRLNTIFWTSAVLGVLYACVLCVFVVVVVVVVVFGTCSAQLSMFHMERRSRNMLIIVVIIIIISFDASVVSGA